MRRNIALFERLENDLQSGDFLVVRLAHHDRKICGGQGRLAFKLKFD